MKEKQFKTELFYSHLFFMAGIIIGMILLNVIWKKNWKQDTLSMIYLINLFLKTGYDEKDYFMKIISERGILFLFCMLCGPTALGIPVMILWLGGIGIMMGTVIMMSLLQFGFVGGLVGITIFMPHFLFYLPAAFGTASIMWKQSACFYKKKRVHTYIAMELQLLVLWCIGMVAESKMNPLLMKKMIEFIWES